MALARVRVLASYAGVALVLAAAAPLLSTSPASAAAVTRTIELTADGAKPAALTAAVGDSILFRNTDQTFVHSVGSTGTNWEFTCGPLAPGQACPPIKLTKPGIYTYEGTGLDAGRLKGKVTVPAAAPSPARSASAAPRSTATRAPGTGSTPAPASSASPAGGTGSAGPPITGGFGSVGAPTPPPPAGPAPDVAPVLPGGQVSSPQPGPSGPLVEAAPGRLAAPTTARRYGLPAALAAVAAAGVGSLLVRLLLAHPAAQVRRRTGPGPAVTVD
jgi:plastocyanin